MGAERWERKLNKRRKNAIKSNDIILSLFLYALASEKYCFITIEGEERTGISSDVEKTVFCPKRSNIPFSFNTFWVLIFREDDEWFFQTQVNDTERCGWESWRTAMYFLSISLPGFKGRFKVTSIKNSHWTFLLKTEFSQFVWLLIKIILIP